MAGASGKKLDDTYKLAWLRGLKTTYYLRTMGHARGEVHRAARFAERGVVGR
jgi:ribonucleoside-diphosphate reductase alpha chain